MGEYKGAIGEIELAATGPKHFGGVKASLIMMGVPGSYRGLGHVSTCLHAYKLRPVARTTLPHNWANWAVYYHHFGISLNSKLTEKIIAS